MSVIENRRLSGWLGVASFVSIAAVALHMIALPAMRFNDVINDPWNKFPFYQYGLDGIFLGPVLTGVISWTYYEVPLWNFVHLGVCLGGVGWGGLVILKDILDNINCNAFTGLTPDTPWCINRNYPANTNPDMFWYFCFITTAVSVGMCIIWMVIGTRIRGANVANMYARLQGITGSKIGQTIIGANFVGDAMSAQLERDAYQYTVNANSYVKEAIQNFGANHPEANQILVQALAEHAKQIGYELETYEKYRNRERNLRTEGISLDRTLNGYPPISLAYHV